MFRRRERVNRQRSLANARAKVKRAPLTVYASKWSSRSGVSSSLCCDKLSERSGETRARSIIRFYSPKSRRRSYIQLQDESKRNLAEKKEGAVNREKKLTKTRRRKNFSPFHPIPLRLSIGDADISIGGNPVDFHARAKGAGAEEGRGGRGENNDAVQSHFEFIGTRSREWIAAN